MVSLALTPIGNKIQGLPVSSRNLASTGVQQSFGSSLGRELSRMGTASVNLVGSVPSLFTFNGFKNLFESISVFLRPPQTTKNVEALVQKLLELSKRDDFDLLIQTILDKVFKSQTLTVEEFKLKIAKIINNALVVGMRRGFSSLEGSKNYVEFATKFTQEFDKLDSQRSKESAFNFLRSLIGDSSMRQVCLEPFLSLLERDEPALFEELRKAF